MLHVTTAQLEYLEKRQREIVRWRDETIRQAQKIIRETNREFDKLAIPLGRQINQLRRELAPAEEPAPAPAPRQRARAIVVPEGLDDEDAQHFRELAAKRRRK